MDMNRFIRLDLAAAAEICGAAAPQTRQQALPTIVRREMPKALSRQLGGLHVALMKSDDIK